MDKGERKRNWIWEEVIAQEQGLENLQPRVDVCVEILQ